MVAVGLGCPSGFAHAERCAQLKKEVAAAAVRNLEHQESFIRLCEPCEERIPSPPVRISSVSIDRYPEDGEAFARVYLNGTPTDLASIYVPRGTGQYQNLALLAGCDAPGVSPTLRVEQATANGVLIYPDDPAIAPPPVAVAPVVTRTIALPPEVVVVAAPAASIWPGIAGGAGGASMIWAAWALATSRRRRRAMRPRAADLIERT